MAYNPLPTLSVVNYKGAGSVAVYKLLGGVSLDPTQDGSNVTASLESPPGGTGNNHGNRIVEFLGKRFLIQGHRVYERDNGGAGNWGVVSGTSGLSATDYRHSGLHVLYPGGTPTLAYLFNDGSLNRCAYSTNGTSFTVVSGPAGNALAVGPSASYEDSIFMPISFGGSNGGYAMEYNFSTSSLTLNVPSGVSIYNASAGYSFLNHRGSLFFQWMQASSYIVIWRRDGSGAFNQIISLQPNSQQLRAIGEGTALIPDGNDIVLLYPENITNAQKAARIRDAMPGGSPSYVDITSPVLPGLPSGERFGFTSYTSYDPDPRFPTSYFWFRAGNDHNAGVAWQCYRFNFRQITHGSVTNGPFVEGEFVEQANSGARGRIVVVGAGSLDLTDVTGTFNNTDTITGDDSGAFATASSLLVEQAATFLGNGPIASQYGLPRVNEGGADRIPVASAARPSFTGVPVEVPGGGTSWEFRCYGTGAALSFRVYLVHNDGAFPSPVVVPLSSISIESGSPATTPAISGGNQIDNLTPDGGSTLYSVVMDIASLGVTPGDRYSLMMDPV